MNAVQTLTRMEEVMARLEVIGREGRPMTSEEVRQLMGDIAWVKFYVWKRVQDTRRWSLKYSQSEKGKAKYKNRGRPGSRLKMTPEEAKARAAQRKREYYQRQKVKRASTNGVHNNGDGHDT